VLTLIAATAPGYVRAQREIRMFAEEVNRHAPPVPSPGYDSAEEMTKAAAAGKLAVAEWNVPVPEGVEETRNIEFGKGGGRPLLLDLFKPAGLNEAVPGIVFIHGGGWLEGAKEDIRHFATHCAKRGYVTVSIEYRLSPEAPFPAQAQDAKCAVRWVRSHAAELGVDPERIAVAGASAGAHIAMMTAYASDSAEFEGAGGWAGTRSEVQAVIEVYGPTNLAAPYFRDAEFVQMLMGGETYTDAPEAYEAASPLTHVTSHAPPTLIIQGTTDKLVPVAEADELAKKLDEAGVPYLYDRIEGWPHAMDCSVAVKARCLHFIDAFLDKFLPLPANAKE
jgi:acetyl esterase/lipase